MPVVLSPQQLDHLQLLRTISARPEMTLAEVLTSQGQHMIRKTMPTGWLAFRLRLIFTRRLKLLTQLQDPHLARLIAGQIDQHNTCVTVTEFLPHGSLYDAIAPGERRLWTLPLPTREAVRLVAEVAEGLRTLHRLGEMHGGVKLTNILLAQNNDGPWRALLTDALLHLGLSGYASPSFARRPMGIADPLLYIAPEQYLAHPALASDQYALGMVAFVLLAGVSPLTSDPREWLSAPDPRPLASASALNPTLSPAIDAVLARALRRQPRQRYRSVIDFADALRQASAAPDVARSVHIMLPADVAAPARAPTRAPATRAHEAVEAPRPLALMSTEPDVVDTGSISRKLPELPPNYRWTSDALASVPAPAVPPKTTIHRAGSPRVNIAIGAVMVSLGLVMLGILWLLIQTMHH